MSSSIRGELEGFVAGRVQAERLVIAVAAEYYRETRNGKRETLRPIIDVIDRASPGIVELGIVPGGAGFEIRLAERPFPSQYEAELRRAAEAVLSGNGKRETRNRKRLGLDPEPVQPRVTLTTSAAGARSVPAPPCRLSHRRRRANRRHRGSDRRDASPGTSSLPARTAWTAPVASCGARAGLAPRACAPARTSRST